VARKMGERWFVAALLVGIAAVLGAALFFDLIW
jgi:hypothetical protein